MIEGLLEQPSEVIGYKGFKKVDGQLKCKNMIYEEGKVYVLGTKPKLGSSGFHFCTNLEDVFTFYSNGDKNNVFYKVKVSGEIQYGLGKHVAGTIELLSPVAEEEMTLALIGDALTDADKILACNSDAIIGGSLALIMQGVIPARTVSDLDIIVPYFTDFNGNATINTEFTDGSGGEAIKTKFKHVGMKVDVFVSPKAVYQTIEFNGKKYKVNDATEICLAKAKYLFENKKIKHANDLIHVMNSLNERNSMYLRSKEILSTNDTTSYAKAKW